MNSSSSVAEHCVVTLFLAFLIMPAARTFRKLRRFRITVVLVVELVEPLLKLLAYPDEEWLNYYDF